jgi:hypothetical protein
MLSGAIWHEAGTDDELAHLHKSKERYDCRLERTGNYCGNDIASVGTYMSGFE